MASPMNSSDPLAKLTPRQREIGCLIVEGLSEREIADRLFVSQHTVHEHIRHIYQQMNWHHRSQLIAAFLGSRYCDSRK